jgi:hypothetical protein
MTLKAWDILRSKDWMKRCQMSCSLHAEGLRARYPFSPREMARQAGSQAVKRSGRPGRRVSHVDEEGASRQPSRQVDVEGQSCHEGTAETLCSLMSSWCARTCLSIEAKPSLMGREMPFRKPRPRNVSGGTLHAGAVCTNP